MLDGSSFSMPDTPQLMERFGHPTGQKRGCAFPVAHLMMMIDLATGLIIETLTASWTAHDLTQSVKMLGCLQRGDIALGDRAFGSWGFLTLVLQHQRDAVVRAHGRLKIDFNPDRSRDRHPGESQRSVACLTYSRHRPRQVQVRRLRGGIRRNKVSGTNAM